MINKIVVVYFVLCLLTFVSCKNGMTNNKSNKLLIEDSLSKTISNKTETIIENKIDLKEDVGAVEEIQLKETTKVQDCKECFEIAKDVRASMNNLTDGKVNAFLQCYNKTCFTNVELSEFGNELLYSLLIKDPELVLRVLTNHLDLSIDFICHDLENPLNEGINVNKAYEQVTNVQEYRNMKERILKAIKIAIDKNNFSRWAKTLN